MNAFKILLALPILCLGCANLEKVQRSTASQEGPRCVQGLDLISKNILDYSNLGPQLEDFSKVLGQVGISKNLKKLQDLKVKQEEYKSLIDRLTKDDKDDSIQVELVTARSNLNTAKQEQQKVLQGLKSKLDETGEFTLETFPSLKIAPTRFSSVSNPLYVEMKLSTCKVSSFSLGRPYYSVDFNSYSVEFKDDGHCTVMSLSEIAIRRSYSCSQKELHNLEYFPQL